MDISTICVKEHKDNKSTHPHQLPIYATSSFEMNSVDEAVDIFTGQRIGHVYGRYGNPTIDTVAAKLAALEVSGHDIDAYGYLTSSGMSAISTLIYALGHSGDNILTQANLYGGTTELFNKVAARHGMHTDFMSFDDLSEVKHKLESKKYSIIYLETPTNPTLDCVDLQAVASLAKAHGVLTIVDNTFCTPYLQQPLSLGIDFVIHSTTKYLNGHGNSIAGAIIGSDRQWRQRIWETLKLMGGTCNPFDAWLINNGVKTLAIRMDRHCSNALYLAQRLSTTKGISYVNYNGLADNRYHDLAKKQMTNFGGMLSFAIDGDMTMTKKFIDSLKLCTHAPTLGDVDTLVLHPATSSHLNVDKAIRVANGIPDNLVRMSVGIESATDLYEDILQAIDVSCG